MSDFTFEDLQFLASPEAQQALGDLGAADAKSDFKTITKLRKAFDAREASSLINMAKLRQRALSKFSDVDSLLFVEEALEQSTAHEIAMGRSKRILSLVESTQDELPLVLDLGCGIGGDLLALAENHRVRAYELDPLRAFVAQFNCAQKDFGDRVSVVVGDWRDDLEAIEALKPAYAFADPARRAGEGRIIDLEEMIPPLSDVKKIAALSIPVAVKVSPLIDLDDDVMSEIKSEIGIEFSGHQRDCKEAVLWFDKSLAGKRIVSIYGPESVESLLCDNSELAGSCSILCDEPETLIGKVVCDPHPALVRSGLLDTVIKRLGGQRLDEETEYFCLDSSVEPTPLFSQFEVEQLQLFQMKSLKKMIKRAGIAKLEIKKRNFNVIPEKLRHQIKLAKKGSSKTLILADCVGKKYSLLTTRISHSI